MRNRQRYRSLILIFLLGLLPSWILAQAPSDWSLFDQVELNYQQDTMLNTWLLQATYSVEIRALEGEWIQLAGYIIPDDLSGTQYYLSQFPLASCFFCGGAGPESIMALELQQTGMTFDIDEFVTFSGKLRLAQQSNGIIYRLASAIKIQ